MVKRHGSSGEGLDKIALEQRGVSAPQTGDVVDLPKNFLRNGGPADRVRAAINNIRAEAHAAHFATLCELADLKREVDAMRAELEQLRQLRCAVLARQKAGAELAGLYRERAIARARAAERDPALPLN